MQRQSKSSANILSVNQNANNFALRSSLNSNYQLKQNVSILKPSSTKVIIQSKIDQSSKENQHYKLQSQESFQKRVSFYKSQQNKAIIQQKFTCLTSRNNNSKKNVCITNQSASNSKTANKSKNKKIQNAQQINQIRKRFSSVPNPISPLQECTFRPKISKKSDILARQRNNKNVFQNLYNFQKKIQVKSPGSHVPVSYKQVINKKQILHHYSKYNVLQKHKVMQQQKKCKQVNHQLSSKQKNQFQNAVKLYRNNQSSLKNMNEIRKCNIEQKPCQLRPIQIYRVYQSDRNSVKDLTIEDVELEADSNLKNYIQNTLHRIESCQRNIKTEV